MYLLGLLSAGSAFSSATRCGERRMIEVRPFLTKSFFVATEMIMQAIHSRTKILLNKRRGAASETSPVTLLLPNSRHDINFLSGSGHVSKAKAVGKVVLAVTATFIACDTGSFVWQIF